jgi:excinuclease ABC subunit A
MLTDLIFQHKPFYQLNEHQKELLWTGKSNSPRPEWLFKELEEKNYKIQNRCFLGTAVKPNAILKGKRLRIEASYEK